MGASGQGAAADPSRQVAGLAGGDLIAMFLLGEVAAVVLAFAFATALNGLRIPPVPAAGAELLASYYLSAGCLLGAVAYWLRARRLRGVLAAMLRAVPVRLIGLGILAGAVLKAVGGVLTAWEQTLIPHIVPNNPVVTAPALFQDPVRVALLVVAAVGAAPLAEEVFYRGVLFRWLRGRMPLGAAIVVSGAIFGLAHLDLTLALPLAAVGAGLAWLYSRTERLLPCIAAHACLNAISLLLALGALR